MEISRMLEKWWPGKVDRTVWESKLADFYSYNASYHAMTASGDKSTHPQVKHLLSRIETSKRYAEVGCGGGLVSGLVAKSGAFVNGFDLSPIAVENAKLKYGCENARFEVAPADAIPLADASVDGVWSFEMLEHVWDPVAALREMVRIVKPGGFVFVTSPNHFSLDLQLHKRPLVRGAELGFAFMRYLHDIRVTNILSMSSRIF